MSNFERPKVKDLYNETQLKPLGTTNFNYETDSRIVGTTKKTFDYKDSDYFYFKDFYNLKVKSLPKSREENL